MATLPTNSRNKRFRNITVAVAIGISAIVGGALFIAPQIATARTVNSIQIAIKGRVQHIERFEVADGEEKLIEETWSQGQRFRRDAFVRVVQPFNGDYRENTLPVETVIGDGAKVMRLAHQAKTVSFQPYTSEYNRTGDDIEAILRDMGSRKNLGLVAIENSKLGPRDVLIARFRDELADFVFYCDPESRLPFKLEIDSSLGLGRHGVRNVLYYDFPIDVDGEVFSMEPPDGYRVIEPDSNDKY